MTEPTATPPARRRGAQRTALIAALLLLFSGALQAERQLEVIDLLHIDAETVIDSLRPHLDGEVSLSGTGSQLLVRGDASILEEVRSLTRELDRPPQPIRISVRTERPGTRIESGVGRERSGRSSRVYSTRDRRGNEQSYSVRANANVPAHIGRSVRLPVTERDIASGRGGVRYREQTGFIQASEGFYATARLHGDSVTVELAVASGLPSDTERPSRQQQVVTRVTGMQGQWIAVGEIDDRRIDERRGTTHRTRSRDEQAGNIWLRVDSLDER